VSTAVAPTRPDRRPAIVFVVALAALMWVAEILDTALGGDLDAYGIQPRDPDGLVGVGAAPLLHAGFGHLLANTVPFLALGAIIALAGLATVVWVTVIVALVGGLGTWLVAPAGTIHLGASGVVFGYATYLISRALFSHSLAHLGVGVLVLALYGSTLALGVVPRDGISWQGHLFGGLGGVLAAWLLEARRRAPAGTR
jgi:membrane associated rhomboid family serine protease